MIKRLWVKNYRSLADVSVDLEPLTVLVGANGSGKSNFIDALSFVADALKMGLYVAISKRGGFDRLRHWLAKPINTAVEIGLQIETTDFQGIYSFVIDAFEPNDYQVVSEICKFKDITTGNETVWFETKDGAWVVKPAQIDPFIQPHLLTLPLIAVTTPFGASIFQFLTHMSFYNIFPKDIAEPQLPMRPYPLDENGKNLASTLQYLQATNDKLLRSLEVALQAAVPTVTETLTFQVGGYLVTQLNHKDGIGTELVNESDGTLRILAILTALYQEPPLSLITFEEPELFVHPGVLPVLWEEFENASIHSQMILTTHSPDLLDVCHADQLRVVEKISGVTVVGLLEEAQRRIVQKRLATPGQLLQTEGLYRAQPA